MATFYVNSITGNNSNSGASWALAKATLAGVYAAASNGDTIYCHGRFGESLTFNKTLTWIGHGYCVFHGNSKGLSGHTVNTAGTVWIGVTFSKYASFGIQTYASTASFPRLYRCTIDDCDIGVYTSTNYGQIYLVDCVMKNNTIAAAYGNANFVAGFTNCVFVGNAVSIKKNASYVMAGILTKCILRDLVFWEVSATAGNVSDGTNYNIYDFSFGKCVVGGVDKTTLAAWIASLTAPLDAQSIDRAWSSDVGDRTNELLLSNPSSYLLTAGPGLTPIGLTLPAVTLSNTKNATLWTGGVFSNTEIDGSGYLVLSAGQTSGYWRSDIIDFGANINAKCVEISAANESATQYLDYDTGDSPGYFNVRVRGSAASFLKSDASPSWVTVPRGAEIGNYMSNALRYWQIEITLRGT